MEEIKRSANKFASLEINEEVGTMSKGNEKDNEKNGIVGVENDVLPVKNGIAQSMEEDLVEGIDRGVSGNQ